jgi:ABC-type uncharacterized transport system substrate-binding protein
MLEAETGKHLWADRILKSEKPADLPVQLSVKYETVLNMTTAKALGLDVPTRRLLRRVNGLFGQAHMTADRPR